MPQKLSKGAVLRSRESGLGALQRLIDPVLIAGTYATLHLTYGGGPWSESNTIAVAVAILTFLVAAELNGLYRSWRGAFLRQAVVKVSGAWLGTSATLLFLAFLTRSTEAHSRVVSVGWVIAAPLALACWRFLMRSVLGQLRSRGYNARSVAIAGSTTVAERLARTLKGDPSYGLSVHGIYDDRHRRRHALPEELGLFRGALAQLVDDAKAGVVDIVYITLPLRAEERITQLVGELADSTVTVYIVPEFYAYDVLHAQWSALGDLQVVSIFDSPFHGLGGWLKRFEDVVVGAMILLIIAVPMLIIGIVVKLDSRGPMLFRQRRYGLNGKPIYVLKFRSMTVCEDGDDVKQAQVGDARFTKVGAFLRRTSLDELPQFLNVMAGSMSIVGPRPHAVAHNELYRKKVHGYMLRHKVKPGITGWAQVNGWRGETDTIEKMEKRIEYDLYYIHNWRLDWDLRIIWLTVFGKGTRRNAF